jgi:hypothetical protein
MITVAVIIVVLLALGGLVVTFLAEQNRRTEQLRERFGPEYERAVENAGNRRQAERHLTDVVQRRDQLDVRDLDERARTQLTAEWAQVQARFVDEPGRAVDAAEILISTVMRERGYPVDDFDQRADLIAIDHPAVVQYYRAAHAAQQRHSATGGVNTEELRLALLHYRSLFAALIRGDGDQAVA